MDTATRQHTRISFSDTELGRALDDADRNTVQLCLRERAVHAGTAIYAPGEASEEFLLIQSGSVLITQSLNGIHIELARLGAGSFFGENALIKKNDTHHTEARATHDTALWSLSKNSFATMCAQSPHAAYALMAHLADTLGERLRDDAKRIGIISEISSIVLNTKELNNINSLAKNILRITLVAIPSRTAFLALYDRHHPQMLNTIASVNTSPKDVPKKILIDTDPILHALHNKKNELRIDAPAYADGQKVFYAKRNVLAHTIRIEDKDVGIVLLADKTTGDYTPQNSLLLSIIASHISFALEEAHVRQERKAIEELGRTYVGM